MPAGLLRLSVGLEDPEALWADLGRRPRTRTCAVDSVGRLAYHLTRFYGFGDRGLLSTL